MRSNSGSRSSVCACRKTGRDPIGSYGWLFYTWRSCWNSSQILAWLYVFFYLEEVGSNSSKFPRQFLEIHIMLNLRCENLFETRSPQWMPICRFFWLQHVQQTFQGCFSSFFLLHKPHQAGYFSGWWFQPI